jgi:hypothetical protein
MTTSEFENYVSKPRVKNQLFANKIDTIIGLKPVNQLAISNERYLGRKLSCQTFTNCLTF